MASVTGLSFRRGAILLIPLALLAILLPGPAPAAVPGAPAETPPAGRAAVDYPSPDVPAIRSLFFARRFQELSDLLGSYLYASETDSRYEYAAFDGLWAVSGPSDEVGLLLDEWVKAMPQDPVPYSARAWHHRIRAGMARGGGWARDTSNEQFRGMEAELELARADAGRAIELRPSLFPGHVVLLDAERLGGTLEGREKLVENALAVCPDSHFVRESFLQGLLPRWGGSYEAMEDFLVRSEASAERNPKIRALRGLAPKDRGDALLQDPEAEWNRTSDQARLLYEEAVAFGDEYHLLVGVGEQILVWGDSGRASELAERAVAIRPVLPAARALRGRLLVAAGRDEEALEELRTIAAWWGEESGEAATVRKGLSTAFVFEGGNRFRQKAFARALEAYDLAVRLRPESADAWCWRGVTLLRLRKAVEGEADLRKALELDPGLYEAAVNLTELLVDGERYGEISGLWTRYLRREPKSAAGYFQRAQARYLGHNLPGAFIDAHRADALGYGNGSRLRSVILLRLGTGLIVLLLGVLLLVQGTKRLGRKGIPLRTMVAEPRSCPSFFLNLAGTAATAFLAAKILFNF